MINDDLPRSFKAEGHLRRVKTFSKYISNQMRKAPMENNSKTHQYCNFKDLEQSSSNGPAEMVQRLDKDVVISAFYKLLRSTESKHTENDLALTRREMFSFLKYIENDDKVCTKIPKELKFAINSNLKKLMNIRINENRSSSQLENEWYRRSGLYAPSGNIHTDRRLYHTKRQTQGLGVVVTYAAEAVTALATAFSTYLMYKTGSNVYKTVESSINGFNATDILAFIKDNIVYLVAILTSLCQWYKGEVSTSDATFQIIGILTVAKIFANREVIVSNLVSTFMSILKPFPANSTHRETQGFEPTTLAENLISIILLLGLGSNQLDPNLSKTILGSIRTLSATILTVKTIEGVFIKIITFLPEIFQAMLCEYIPSFALYVAITTDKVFKNFIDVTSELRATPILDIVYNSHNLSRFLRMRDYCIRHVCTPESIRQGRHKLLDSIITWYDETFTVCEKLGLIPGRRKLPYVIWLSGAPGIGKSTLVHELAQECLGVLFGNQNVKLKNDFDLSRLIYTHNTANKFFDGYNNQPIFVLNDYLQFAQENEEQWLIRFADTNDCPLEVSSVDNIDTGVKGEVRFTSRIIIVTSNVTHMFNSTTVTNLEAFNRRRDVVLEMLWKEGYDGVDLSNFDYSWCQFYQRESRVSGRERIIPISSKTEALFVMIRNVRAFLDVGPIGFENLDKFTKSNGIRANLEMFQCVEDNRNKLVVGIWNDIKTFLDKTVFGIKIKYLIPLTMTGSAAYLLYKTWLPAVISKFSHSLSGDMATQKLQKKTKPLVRTTMGNRQNDTELGLKLMNNVVRVTTTILDPHGRMMNQTMWGWSSGGSLIVTPKHLWYRGGSRVKDGDHVKINRGDKDFDFYVNDQNLLLFENEDVAIINVLGMMPPFRSIENLIIDGATNVDEAGEDVMIVMPTNNEGTPVPVLIPTRAYLTNAPYVDEYKTEYPGKNVWQYNQRMMKGDCGAILCMKTKNGMKIAGMHVAGDSFSGNAEVITSYTIKNATEYFSTKRTQGFTTDMEIDDEQYFDAESDLEGNFYFLGKVVKPPYQKSETQIVKSPLYEVLQPHMTEPAVLSPTDKRMVEITSPILQSVSKYGKFIPPFNKDLMDDAFDIVRSFYEPISQHNLKVFSFNDAISSKYTPNLEKLDLSTSAGYPWNTRGLQKSDLIDKDEDGNLVIKPELEKAILRNEKLLLRRTMFPYTLVTTLKDERVSLQKVRIGKTRTFMNFPVEYTILMRKYFDDFIDKETLYAMEIGTTVGVNIYSSRWHDLFMTLNKFDYVTDGDFKAFDGSIRPEFFKYYSTLVNNMYNDEYKTIRDMLCTGCCFAPIFVLDKVYMKLQGNPSGSRLTTSFNSFVNRMYVVMSMLLELPQHLRTRQFFKENVKIFAHGDDHIIGFSEIVKEHWDALELQRFMATHNIEYTSSSKEEELKPHRKLYDCYYLKSRFVFNKSTGKYQAGLDKEVIQEMVSWQRDHNLQSTEMIVQTCQRYAYFWGQAYFDEITSKLRAAIKEKHLPIELLDFNSLEQYYLYNEQMDFSYV